MRRRYSLSILLFIGLILIAGCKEGKKGLLTPTSSALPYELLLVIDDATRASEAGKLLKDILTSDVPGLPQRESAFKLMQINPIYFDGVLKPVRNIVIVQIDKGQFTKASMSKAVDVYAYPQNVMRLTSPNTELLVDMLKERGAEIVSYFTKAEMQRQVNILSTTKSDVSSKLVNSMFGADVWLPTDLTATKEGEDFLWVGTNSGDVNKYFVMYSIPYTDKDSFTKDYFIHKRDSVMKINIPGESEGMYMTTESDFVEVKPITVRGEYALEARGLWRMKNDFMGGPFVSHMRLDSSNNILIFTEVFVYAPEKLKRNLIRPMEASLYTVRLADEIGKDNLKINEKIEDEK